ncbi:hypothetical protein ABFS82_08G220400 [Erythranthe guttata]
MGILARGFAVPPHAHGPTSQFFNILLPHLSPLRTRVFHPRKARLLFASVYRPASADLSFRPRLAVLSLSSDTCVCGLQQGDNGTVFRVVLLFIASNITVEQNGAQMERFRLYFVVDRSSNALVVVGLFTRVSRQERILSTMDGEFIFLGC